VEPRREEKRKHGS